MTLDPVEALKQLNHARDDFQVATTQDCLAALGSYKNGLRRTWIVMNAFGANVPGQIKPALDQAKAAMTTAESQLVSRECPCPVWTVVILQSDLEQFPA